MDTDNNASFRPKSVQTRFLYPFFFKRLKSGAPEEQASNIKKVTDAILSLSLPRGEGKKPVSLWERPGAPHTLYTEELTVSAASIIFRSLDGANGLDVSDERDYANSLYFRVPNDARNLLLQGAEIIFGPFKTVNDELSPSLRIKEFSFIPDAEIELLLSPHGFGVLSIGLGVIAGKTNIERFHRTDDGSVVSTPVDLDMPVISTFNYALSQGRIRTSARIGKATSPMTFAERDRNAEKSVPMRDRMGVQGSCFTLWELAQALTEPLKCCEFKASQDQLSVYTLVRYGSDVDFENGATRKTLLPQLAGLAQIEEAAHAGEASDCPGITYEVMNRRHMAGVGLLGAAHFTSDQPPGIDTFTGIVQVSHPFNEQRSARIMLKYFVPFLIAQFQRLAVQRAVAGAADCVRAGDQNTATVVGNIRSELLEFTVDGQFTLVSSRQALHRFYRMAQAGLDIHAAKQDARRAFEEIDSREAGAKQTETMRRMEDNTGVSKSVQLRLEYIEIMFASVYGAHLFEMVGSNMHAKEGPGPWVILAGAAIGAVMGFAVLKPGAHGVKRHSSRRHRIRSGG